MARAWCKHYRGMSVESPCEAGVRFSDLPGYGASGFLETCPCLGPTRGECDKAEYPTAEEIAAEKEALRQRIAQTDVARKAIVTHLGGPWRKGMPSASGVVDCPVCGKEKSLQFSRSGYNGHIHAICSTRGCVWWME